MRKQLKSEFMNKLIDWNDFECFIQKMYEEDPNLTVQHNVTLVGKSGAKRQIDVLVKQKTKMTTMITIVECKRWKQRVNRGIIDIVSAAIDDLNANKGVVFTTSGYEEGAIEYAKYKNIDIFLVRDLLDEEWGRPGRHVQFWLQFIGSKIENLVLPNVAFIPFYVGAQPNLNLEICANKEDSRYFLYDKNGQKGLYLGTLLMKIQEKIHCTIGDKVALLTGEEAKNNVLYKSDVIVNMSDYAHNILHFSNGLAIIKQMKFSLLTSITQSNFQLDRGKNLDFALMVENYIVNQKHTVIKHKDEELIHVSDNLVEIKSEDIKEEEVLHNGSIFKIYLQADVVLDITGNELVKETKEITVNISD